MQYFAELRRGVWIAKGKSMSPSLIPLVFIAAVTALASAVLGGLYLLLRREPIPDKKASKKIVVSNVR
jgi:hypothetical protein